MTNSVRLMPLFIMFKQRSLHELPFSFGNEINFVFVDWGSDWTADPRALTFTGEGVGRGGEGCPN